MSEPTIPFQGQTAVMERPASEVEPDPSGGSRTTLLALGALAGVLVLGVVGYFLFLAGGDDSVPEGPVTKPPAAAPVDPAPEAEVVKEPSLTAKNYGRDPFKALIVESETTTTETTVDGATTTGGTSTGGTSTGSAPGTSTGSTGSTGGSTQPETSTPQPSRPHTFKVVSVAPDNSAVTVKVDGETYRNLAAGDVFAKYFKVVLISGDVNSFQYGEEKFNVLGTKKLTIA